MMSGESDRREFLTPSTGRAEVDTNTTVAILYRIAFIGCRTRYIAVDSMYLFHRAH